MRLVGVALVTLWVPVAAVLGPVAMLRHGPGQYAGGAVAVTIPFAVCWLWYHLEQRPARRPAMFVAGALLGVGLLLTSYGRADALYLRRTTYERPVVVARVDCVRVKYGCTDQAALSTPDGRPLPMLMYDLAGARTVGERLTVRWDRLGYASPTPLTWSGTDEPYEPQPSLAPAWIWAGLLVLHLAAVAGLAVRRRPARRSPSGGEARSARFG